MQNKHIGSIQKAIEVFRKHHGFLKTTEALYYGIQPRTLYAMHNQKIIEQLTRGLFRLSGIAPLSHQDLVIVAKKFPKGR